MKTLYNTRPILPTMFMLAIAINRVEFVCAIVLRVYSQGRQTGGGGWGGLNPPEFWMGGGGVEHLSTPPDFEKKNLGGVGSP